MAPGLWEKTEGIKKRLGKENFDFFFGKFFFQYPKKDKADDKL